ncbi:hypothetical protein HDU96_004875, partial [Phlyctochytrium bullatum]
MHQWDMHFEGVKTTYNDAQQLKRFLRVHPVEGLYILSTDPKQAMTYRGGILHVSDDDRHVEYVHHRTRTVQHLGSSYVVSFFRPKKFSTLFLSERGDVIFGSRTVLTLEEAIHLDAPKLWKGAASPKIIELGAPRKKILDVVPSEKTERVESLMIETRTTLPLRVQNGPERSVTNEATQAVNEYLARALKDMRLAVRDYQKQLPARLAIAKGILARFHKENVE